jgi:hypothetical protein
VEGLADSLRSRIRIHWPAKPSNADRGDRKKGS